MIPLIFLAFISYNNLLTGFQKNFLFDDTVLTRFFKELNSKVPPNNYRGNSTVLLLWREVKLRIIHILAASAPFRCSPSFRICLFQNLSVLFVLEQQKENISCECINECLNHFCNMLEVRRGLLWSKFHFHSQTIFLKNY